MQGTHLLVVQAVGLGRVHVGRPTMYYRTHSLVMRETNSRQCGATDAKQLTGAYLLQIESRIGGQGHGIDLTALRGGTVQLLGLCGTKLNERMTRQSIPTEKHSRVVSTLHEARTRGFMNHAKDVSGE